MKKIILLLATTLIITLLNAQTVGDKSTELGYSLSQKVIDINDFIGHFKADTFYCYTLQAAIPPDTNQRGSTVNFYYFDNLECAADTSLPQAVRDTCGLMYQNVSKARLEDCYLLWHPLSRYEEIPKPDSTYVKQ